MPLRNLPLHPAVDAGEDEVKITDLPSSVSFRYKGRDFFLLADDLEEEPNAYYDLKRRMVVTYRIAAMRPAGPDLHYCRLAGSDGSELEIHLSTEDLFHNIRETEKHTQVQHVVGGVC
jgi:hypothetical protein